MPKTSIKIAWHICQKQTDNSKWLIFSTFSSITDMCTNITEEKKNPKIELTQLTTRMCLAEFNSIARIFLDVRINQKIFKTNPGIQLGLPRLQTNHDPSLVLINKRKIKDFSVLTLGLDSFSYWNCFISWLDMDLLYHNGLNLCPKSNLTFLWEFYPILA